MKHDEYEAYLHEQLAALRRSYEASAKPLLDALYRLHAMKPPPPLFIDVLSLPPEQREFIMKLKPVDPGPPPKSLIINTDAMKDGVLKTIVKGILE